MRLINNKLSLNKQYYGFLGTFELTKRLPYNRIYSDPRWYSTGSLKSRIKHFDVVYQVFENLLLHICFNLYEHVTFDYLMIRDENE